ncbi:MAG: hypothetical protein QME51_01795 [Planctomycetota bacterium]|nr:hypothetical protein [Planctomycetota bacterium]MDI6787087.1 hypothetical protein [Planctomycetota bacterium]
MGCLGSGPLVRQEEDYLYSSAKSHVLDVPDEVLREQLFDKEERKWYIEFLKVEPTNKEINTIRKATKIGRPLGDENLINKIAGLLDHHFLKTVPTNVGTKPRK